MSFGSIIGDVNFDRLVNVVPDRSIKLPFEITL